MDKKISDYGIIGNLHTAALIGNDGSVDWLCLPDLDSPSVFAALLDRDKGGCFSVRPAGPWRSQASYLPGTNILSTTFRTESGVLKLTDFMPVAEEETGAAERDAFRLYRRMEVLAGEVEIEMRYTPRFDFARAETHLQLSEGGIVTEAEGLILTLQATAGNLRVVEGRAEGGWRLREGDDVWLSLSWKEDGAERLTETEGVAALRETEAFWRHWLAQREAGGDLDCGSCGDLLDRSALVLKLLQFRPTGAIAAAVTTSLPEEIGGERNWDYRYSWVRDSALTLSALLKLGHVTETGRYLRWLKEILCACLSCVCPDCQPASHLQVLYGLRGETELPEATLDHLAGFRGSAPVRIGNAAARQTQLDIYGEIMDAALLLATRQGGIDDLLRPVLRSVADYVCERWQEKDAGIWEVRGGPFDFVHSRVMCWAALDRALTMARSFALPGDGRRWQRTAEEIRREVLSRGWSEKKQAFVQHYETEDLDAACLLFPLFGFLPFDDFRMVSTVAAVQRELVQNGLVYRYRNRDGLPGREGVFLPCTFWLIDNLAGQGRGNEAEGLLQQVLQAVSPLGLFAEEYDPVAGELLGNFPQALSHIGFVNSVVALGRARAGR